MSALANAFGDSKLVPLAVGMVQNLDRLSRDIGQLADFLIIFDKAGVRVKDSSPSETTGSIFSSFGR